MDTLTIGGKPILNSVTVWGVLLLGVGEALCQTGIADAIAAAIKEGATGAAFCSSVKTGGLMAGILGLRRASGAPTPPKP